jgi:hypothetical protein
LIEESETALKILNMDIDDSETTLFDDNEAMNLADESDRALFTESEAID